MKKLIITLLLTLSMMSSAKDFGKIIDEVIVPLSAPNKIGLLDSSQIYGGIRVTGYSGKDVVVIVHQRQKNYKVVKKNGLKMIPNLSFNLEIEENNNTVHIRSQPHGAPNPVNLEIKVPYNFNLRIKNINNGNTYVENVNGEIEVSNINGSITLKSVSGSITADTINGALLATIKEVGENANMAFSCLNHDIDITLPKNTKANIKAKTLKGNIFTGFEMAMDKNELGRKLAYKKDKNKYGFEQWVKGTINGGGPEYTFSSLNGDIIIREED
jgi:hypothetical protein